MNKGMQWFDDSNNPLDKKLSRGMDYFQKKYNRPVVKIVININEIDIEYPILLEKRKDMRVNHYLYVFEENESDKKVFVNASDDEDEK
jgi:hypothetical protein